VTARTPDGGGAGDLLLVEVRGDFDLAVADRLRPALLEAIPREEPLVAFDLCDCTHVDTVALGLIMDTHGIARDRSGAVALVCPDQPHPAIVPLHLSSLHEVIQLFPSREVFNGFVDTFGGVPATNVMRVSEAAPAPPVVSLQA
jgi:anti-anti-sigma factor